MAPHRRSVDDLAQAVLDGASIDWTAEESSDTVTSRLVGQLRVVAAVAEAHREASRSSSDGVARRRSFTVPESWGHLRILEGIGQGSFGDVYRAWDTRLDREVALKLLPAAAATDATDLSSMVREGRLLARVRHPNVVTIYGADRIGDYVGLWMEVVHGRTLEELLRAGTTFETEEVTRIGLELGGALAAVHAAGLLHRDIKTQNVMCADDGRIVLMDFGAGRELSDEGSDLAGTPLYIAPEVFRGQPATGQSDIYSLGVVLYHLLTKSYPVNGKTIRDVRAAHEQGVRMRLRIALRTAYPDVPSRLARVFQRAIEPRPDRRYRSADAFCAALRRAAVSPVHRWGWYTAAAAVAAMIGLLVVLDRTIVENRYLRMWSTGRLPADLAMQLLGPEVVTRRVGWDGVLRQPAAWYGSPEAAKVADHVLQHQLSEGGWPATANTTELTWKEISATRAPASIDDGATVTQIRLLDRVWAATREDRYSAAALRGVGFLLASQYPSGGWPQVFPPRGDYSRHITFNDDAIAGVLQLLEDLASARGVAYADEGTRRRANDAIASATRMILRAQIRVNGRLTGWCAQHDEVTLEPRPGRRYEHPSISGRETVEIVRFLMRRPPDDGIVRAVDAAVSWLTGVAIRDHRLERLGTPARPGADVVLRPDVDAPRLWARFYEIGTNRPIYSGRDGIVRYALADIDLERRTGYDWLGRWPAALIDEEYGAWRAGLAPSPRPR
jgi:PelA/Pel-15E family pectate lyase